MKKYNVGYTQGVYDMFHIGHLNLINHAKEYCDYLIVGVNADELVQSYKHKTPVVNQEESKTIVANIKAVDDCIIAYTLDKVDMWKDIKFDAIFIGDDWKGNERWLQTERELEPYGAEVVYLPHTDGISSTILRPELDNKVEG
jgi:glycerol-3-phosphate cytidylyltransferase